MNSKIFLILIIYIAICLGVVFHPRLLKKNYVIAVIGDSMIDTMGTNLPFLTQTLKIRYPEVNFTFYNYGIGAENVATGLTRFDNSYTYQDRSYPPISSLRPDVIIIGSWAYNPFSNYDSVKHKEMLSSIIQKAKKISTNVYLLKEINPIEKKFGNGLMSLGWDEEATIKHVTHIRELLANLDNVSKEEDIPLIDVYQLSQKVDSNETRESYISEYDGIHPSSVGHFLTAETITNTIIFPFLPISQVFQHPEQFFLTYSLPKIDIL